MGHDDAVNLPDPSDHQTLVPLPAQPPDTPYPGAAWPTGDVPATVSLDALMERAFDPEGPLHDTYAVVVIHQGRLVYERYDGLLPQWEGPGKPVDVSTPLLSWSMAKSMLHAVVGMLVAEGRLALDAPAPVAAWSQPGDPRGRITLADLLAMRDGLDFLEDYEDFERSDVLAMLFGGGQGDMAAYAAGRPPAVAPGIRFSYSSGTSNIISGIVASLLGPGDPYREFLTRRLFVPLGMTSADPRFDDAGTWMASSYVYATARDYARFGLLYLRDGVWDGRRLLPEGWVDQGRRPRSVDPDDGTFYGSHFWTVSDRYGTFWAAGHEGQYIDICPALDLVVVRLGKTDADRSELVRAWRSEVLDAFARG